MASRSIDIFRKQRILKVLMVCRRLATVWRKDTDRGHKNRCVFKEMWKTRKQNRPLYNKTVIKKPSRFIFINIQKKTITEVY